LASQEVWEILENWEDKMMIPRIGKILYATDLTKNSAYAAYFAMDLAQKHDAKVVILHCTDQPFGSMYAAGGVYIGKTPKELEDEDRRMAHAEIRKRLDDFCREVGDRIGPTCAELVTEIIVKPGYPVEEILNAADTERCDLIVLGTHGKGWLKQSFLGSTARSVLERSRKPVFVVPLPPEQIDIGWE
jgi:nucleotide-binding universal stress UspA family protein